MKSRLDLSLRRLATGLLGSLAFLFPAGNSVHAADPVRLTELPIHRFVFDGAGRLWLQAGHLESSGTMILTTETLAGAALELPPDIVGRPLVIQASWRGFFELGPQAVANFTADLSAGVRILFNAYFPVAVSPGAVPPSGDLVNISTRAYMAPEREPVIAGFVVSDHRRRVLIRGVGATLSQFGVHDALPDPSITVHQRGVAAPIATNDHWEQGNDAAALEEASGRRSSLRSALSRSGCPCPRLPYRLR